MVLEMDWCHENCSGKNPAAFWTGSEPALELGRRGKLENSLNVFGIPGGSMADRQNGQA